MSVHGSQWPTCVCVISSFGQAGRQLAPQVSCQWESWSGTVVVQVRECISAQVPMKPASLYLFTLALKARWGVYLGQILLDDFLALYYLFILLVLVVMTTWVLHSILGWTEQPSPRHAIAHSPSWMSAALTVNWPLSVVKYSGRDYNQAASRRLERTHANPLCWPEILI